MMKPIDLGMSYDEIYPSPIKGNEEKKKHYPTFRYEGDKPLDLPHEGEMTIAFKKVASSESERDGVHRYECTVEVREILDAEGENDVQAPTKSYGRDSEDALDALMEKKLKEKGY